jgi:CRP-like cAMP-binding protein/Fe-S-cluster-containing dehydrogenase component
MSLDTAPDVESFYEEEEGLFARDDESGRLIRMDRVTAADLRKEITLTIDGREVKVPKAVPATDAQGRILTDEDGLAIPRATTIYDAASKLHADEPGGNPIPILCHRDYLNPVAVCRLCVVEISKVKRGQRRTERKLLPACQHRVEETMEVQTLASPNDPAARDRINAAVKTLVELLMADHPTPCAKEEKDHDCELEALARRLEVGPPRFSRRPSTGRRDDTSLVIAVDHDACILCDRCSRGCNDVKNNQVIGRMAKGYNARIAFDLDRPMGESTCVACGECMFQCPTGALTHKSVVKTDIWEGRDPPAETVEPEDLFGHENPEIREAFAGVSHPFLRFNSDAVVRRRFRKGQLICREGEPGTTAFLIESGSVDVCIEASLGHVADKADRGLFGRFTSLLMPRDKDRRDGERGRSVIPTGDNFTLPFAKPIATMGPGKLFGEMSCLNLYPRSATVRAAEDGTVVLEMLRNVLYIMQRSPAYRAKMEREYRDRALNNHLRSVPLFAPLRENEAEYERFVEELRPRVKLRRCEPGEVIFKQGAPADDGFYLVRVGFVKVSQTRPGGENVRNYVGPGGYFGEIGLLSDLPEVRALTAPGVRTATCTALDHVDLVRISGRDFRDLLDRFPGPLRQTLVQGALQALERDREVAGKLRSDSLDDFLRQGLLVAQSLLVLDLEKCTRCDECTKACADSHEGVTRLYREGLRYDKFLVASSCRSCLDPYCLVGCPVGSIRRRTSGEIFIEDWCIGCGKCAENCPYGNITMHVLSDRERKVAEVQRKATTCDLCRDLGPNAEPSCVYACPHDAAHRMTGQQLFEIVSKAQQF